MKIALYIILILAVIGGGVYAWFYFSKNDTQAGPAAKLPSVSSSSSLPSPSYSIADTFPKTETISIGTGNGSIEVKNFYKTLVDTEEGSIIMADNENYQISYERSTSVFYIHFRNDAVSQSQAEADLLNVLGISQQDACKLNVLVFQPGKTNGAKLSFCTNR
ncbi:MAG: hypothetical protein A3B13_01135 [Candidatus Liptonbacteria bacterium RIFCSPLOWO2_01_FULL_45_15]|uniref:Uncharacterized protein n=1 Tax=Candidatus Liptonbacteria bacterium RIFCSPLOWO2_01_FULL_45_15 TaxID=1798649 RepID=A0A1G2CFY6_9BACT|nr:MAG: hypothetical protein A3B13_01135 [Candidatus Liptonbacteria bacterium RIFCSPLOWO2_01_FULL_45_15]